MLIVQRLGFSLERIRELLASLPAHRTPTKKDWERLSVAIRAELEDRIAIMTRLRDRLDGCIGCGCLSLENCAIYNRDDAAGKLGAGPRFVIEAN